MSKIDTLQPAFNAGELSRRLVQRTDFIKYPAGLAECLNLIPLPEGGLTRRPATRYVSEVIDSTVKGHLQDFKATASQHFILEFGALIIRFFYRQGQLTVADTTAVITNGAFPSGITDWDDRSTGGAGNQISHDSTNNRLTLETSGTASNDIGWAEQDVATGSTGTEHVIKFRVIGDPGDKIEFQIGTATLGAQTLAVVEKEVGYHCVGFTPTTSPFYIQFRNLGSNADKDVQIDDVSIIDNAALNIDTPYAESDLFDIQGTQSNDVRYLFRDGIPTYKLQRFGNTTWSLVKVAWQDGPYLIENTTTTTLTPNATSGVAVTITASSIVGINGGVGFKSTDVGRLVRIDNPSSGVVWGWAIIVGFTSTTVVTVHVKKAFSTAVADVNWRLGAWSDTTGWPKTGGFFEQRLYVASITDLPQTLWASQTADFENHKPDDDAGVVEDDDALDFTLASDEGADINWMSAGEDTLVIGTTSGEWIPSASGIVITPLDVTIRRQTTRGSTLTPPIRVDHVVLFVQKAKRKIFELVFDITFDSYQAPDLTRLAYHLTTSGIVEMVYQQEPDSIVWVVRGDGAVPTMTFRRDEDVVGWAKQVIGGRFETAFKKVWQVDDSASTFVDETTDANDAGSADWTLFPASEAIGDYAAFGFTEPFEQLTFDYLNGTAGVGGKVQWEYWDGSDWQSLSDVIDGTTGFTATAADGLDVTWTVPDNWVKRTINSPVKLYYARAKVTTVYTTNPILDQGYVSGAAVVDSISSISGAEDSGQTKDSNDRNEVWMIVKRTINGVTKRYVEFVERYYDSDEDDQEDAYYADSIITYDSSSATVFTGLDHLEGERVKVWADGSVRPDAVVASNQITLEVAASVVQIGLPYKHRLTTLKVEGGNPAGTAIGKTKRVYGLTFILMDSYTLKFGPDRSNLVEKDFRVVGDLMDTGVPLFTGEKSVDFDSSWKSDTRIVIESEDPAPFTLLGLAPNIAVNPSV